MIKENEMKRNGKMPEYLTKKRRMRIERKKAHAGTHAHTNIYLFIEEGQNNKNKTKNN